MCVCINIFVCIFCCVKIFFVLLDGTCAAAEEAGFELAQCNLEVWGLNAWRS